MPTISSKITQNINQLSAEEVSDIDSEGIDCDINYTNLSNDEIIDKNKAKTENQLIGNKSLEEYVCAVMKRCELRTTESYRLKRPEMSIHSKKKSLKSSREECGETFKRNDDLTEHEKTHQKDGHQKLVKASNQKNISFEMRDETEVFNQNDVNSEEDLNHKSLKSHRKRKINSITERLEYSDDSDIDVDYDISEEQMRGESDNDSEISERKPQIFRCDIKGCPYKGKEKYLLIRHKSRKHLEVKQFKCSFDECDKAFGLSTDLHFHQKFVHKTTSDFERNTLGDSQINVHRSHTEDRPLICMINGCDKAYKDNHSIRVHQLTVHSEEFEDIPWIMCSENGCDFRTKMRFALNEHFKSVHDLAAIEERKRKKFICEWPGCGEAFTATTFLNIHKNDTHSDGYRCDWDECKAVLKTYKRLLLHKRRHQGIYRCDYKGCLFVAPTPSDLQMHKISHSEDRPFKCLINDCNKLFKSETALKSHQLRIHPDHFEDLPWLLCPETGCEFKTKSFQVLSEHKKTHKKYLCIECSKTWKNRLLFDNHMATCHRDEPVNLPYACHWDGCQKRFYKPYLLKDHINSHTMKITYPCHWPGCERVLYQKKSLTNHLNIVHKGKGRSHCPHCDYSSTNPHRLKQHLEKH